MRRVLQYRRTWFWIALLASMLGVAGIPTLILSAIHGMIPLMVLGIIFAADLLYGVPFYWIAYGNACVMCRVVRAIVAEGLVTVTKIAAYLCCNDKIALLRLENCFRRGFLSGYLLQNGIVTKIVKQTPMKPERYRCPYCLGIYDTLLAACPRCGGELEVIPAEPEESFQ